MSFSCVLRREIASKAAPADGAKTRYARLDCRRIRTRMSVVNISFCMLSIMQKFSIIVIMQIVKGRKAKNGLFAGTKG
jgi:hypothetical protein